MFRDQYIKFLFRFNRFNSDCKQLSNMQHIHFCLSITHRSLHKQTKLAGSMQDYDD